jgi:hypothetical protein
MNYLYICGYLLNFDIESRKILKINFNLVIWKPEKTFFSPLGGGGGMQP